MAKRKAEQQRQAVPWGYERWTASDGSELLNRSAAMTYRALLTDLEQSDAVTLTGERLPVAKQALQAALYLEESIKPRDWRIVQALHSPGKELTRLRAMRREFTGRTGRGRGPVNDNAEAVRDWHLLTDPTPLVDAEGCTWLPHHLGYYGLVPKCPRHPFEYPRVDRDRAAEEFRCNDCRLWRTRATPQALGKLAQERGIKNPRLLAVQALRNVHGFSTDAGVVAALRRAGVRGLPAIRSRDW